MSLEDILVSESISLAINLIAINNLKQEAWNESYEYYASNIDTDVVLTMTPHGTYNAHKTVNGETIALGHNDTLDAFRHAYWQTTYTMDFRDFYESIGCSNTAAIPTISEITKEVL